jgi:hypothetical protein
MSGPTIRSLSFLSPGNFADDDLYAGLEDTLRLFEFGDPVLREAVLPAGARAS